MLFIVTRVGFTNKVKTNIISIRPVRSYPFALIWLQADFIELDFALWQDLLKDACKYCTTIQTIYLWHNNVLYCMTCECCVLILHLCFQSTLPCLQVGSSHQMAVMSAIERETIELASIIALPRPGHSATWVNRFMENASWVGGHDMLHLWFTDKIICDKVVCHGG